MPRLADRIPVIAQDRARSGGPAGVAWLDTLDDLAAGLARDWNITFGEPLHGGSEALILPATLADGSEAILKAIIPGAETWESEVAVLRAANGRGYARLYQHDVARRAVLVERLGPALITTNLPVDEQIRIICDTLREAWQCPPDGLTLMTGAEKADSLVVFIDEMLALTGQICHPRTIELAREYARRRRDAFDAATALVGHGDSHHGNLLSVPGSDPATYRFVDPDGLFIEPAYDAGLCLRSWTDELLAGDPVSLAHQRTELLASHTGLEPQPIWEWGYIERISTGLLLHHLNVPKEAGKMLQVADALAMS